MHGYSELGMISHAGFIVKILLFTCMCGVVA